MRRLVVLIEMGWWEHDLGIGRMLRLESAFLVRRFFPVGLVVDFVLGYCYFVGGGVFCYCGDEFVQVRDGYHYL